MSQAAAKESAGPCPVAPSTATHQGQQGEKSTGIPQSSSHPKKPSFQDNQDLRLQAAEALVFVREMTPDLSDSDLFYLERAVDILNRLVDEDHADRAAFQGFC
jgi:hypothetical protein